MRTTIDQKRGLVVVNCPYCLISGLANPVNVTPFVEHEGKREHTTVCNKGHTLRFRTIEEWRETRQASGLQRGI